MVNNNLGKVVWVGRIASAVLGLALVVAVILGVATTALAAVPGDPFRLGKINSINAVTALVGSKAVRPMLLVDNNSAAPGSRALDLRVEPNRSPMTVNATAGKATNLNADRVDGKNAGQIGVNGLERVTAVSAFDSVSSKTAEARCPAGKLVVGTGTDITGGKTGPSGDLQTDVVIDSIMPSDSVVFVEAYEEEPTILNWNLTAFAICANAP